ncbi:MAG: hypothetical protein J5950_06125 [Clostridia bacterium]|nr:hypothetical protein [Clostridia bacterium]
MEEKSKETTIDIGKILLVVWDKILWVILSVAILASACYIVTKITWKPTYSSEIQLYTIMSSAVEKETEITTSQISIRRSVAALYVKAIKKSDSLKQMAQKLGDKGFKITPSQLNRALSISIDSDTSEIIHVRAKTNDAELSYAICEIVGNDAKDIVGDAYIGCTVDIFNHPSLAAGPDKSNALRNGVIGGFAGLVISVAVIVAIYLLDKSIKSGEELESISGIRYLGDIPDITDSFKGSRYEYGHKAKTQS